MTETLCTYAGTRDAVLVDYLYDEIAPDARLAFDRHLLVCAACRAELDALAAVRVDLEQWAPPPASFHVAVEPVSSAIARRPTLGARLGQVPAWAQVAAAMLFLGVAAGVANLEVSYANGELSVRTGWRHAAAPATVTAAAAEAGSVAASQTDSAALRQEMREAIVTAQTPAVAAAAAPSDEAVLRKVRALLKESEQRQQRELALRVAEVAHDAQAQRQADLVRIDRSLAVYQNRTGIEVMRTQQQVNSLAQRVSQKQ